MDSPSAVAEYLSLYREEFRRGIGSMEKTVDFSDARNGDFVTLMRVDYGSELAGGLETCLRSEFMVKVVGLKRKRDDFEIDSGSLALEDDPIVGSMQARSLVEERTLPSSPGGSNIVLIHDSDSDDDDDCVIVGSVMPQFTLPGAPADCKIVLSHDSDSDDEGECVIVGCGMPQSTLAGSRAGCIIPLTGDSDAEDDDDDDDECVIIGCLMPSAVVISDSDSDYEFRVSESEDELRASGADD